MTTKAARDARIQALATALRDHDRQWLQDEIAALPAANARTAAQNRTFRQLRVQLRLLRLVLALVPAAADENDTAPDPT